MREAWVLASLQYQAREDPLGRAPAGALLTTSSSAGWRREASRELAKISVESLCAEPDEDRRRLGRGRRPRPRRAPPAARPARPAAGRPTPRRPALDQFTINLTERAKKGEIDPVIGRDSEIRQVIDILTRRRQNNPILTGEAGVGKTAVVEGFALRIAAGDVPPPLKNVALRTLDLGCSRPAPASRASSRTGSSR